jgi:CheY-like chemotaxis protein
MKGNRPILLVEDDKVDAMTVKRALKELKVKNRLVITHNGEEGLAYLRDPRNARPCVVLLDLRMPRMGGIEFLQIVKNDKILKTIPTVVMTTSDEEQDVVNSYSLGVAGYIIKPVDYSRFVEAIRTVDLYWSLSELPPES